MYETDYNSTVVFIWAGWTRLDEEVGVDDLTREQISCRLVAMALAGVSQRKT